LGKNNLKELSEALNPTTEQKERIFCEILEKAENGIAQRRGFASVKRLRPALVAVVVCCLITTTAFAAVYLGLDMKFLNFLNPSSNEQVEYLANGAYVVDKQIVNKNGTLKIKQVIGDSNLTYILMDFIAPEGVVLDDDLYRFEPCNVDVDIYNGTYGYRFRTLEDENPNDNKISLVMEIHTEESLMGGKIKFVAEALEGSPNLPKTYEESLLMPKSIISGNWETSFMLNFKDYSTTYELNREIMLYGYKATLQSISVSPISIAIKVESPYTKEIHNASSLEPVEFNTFLDEFPITINYKDGTQVTTIYHSGTTHGKYGKNETFLLKTFENVINDKEIESIVFFDVIIPINQ